MSLLRSYAARVLLPPNSLLPNGGGRVVIHGAGPVTEAPAQAILAAACAASVLIGIFSEVLWYKFSPHAAAAAGANTNTTATKSSGRSVHAEPATRSAHATATTKALDIGGNSLLAARLAHLTHLSSLPLYDAYCSDAASAGLSIPDAVRALVRALPDDATAPGEASSSDLNDPALPEYLSPLTSLLTATALANGSVPSDPILTPADLLLIGKLLSTPCGTLSADELKRAVTTACGHPLWPVSPDQDHVVVEDGQGQSWIHPLFPHGQQIHLHEFTHFLTSLRKSLSSAIYSTHASALNGTVMTGADFAWVLLAMYTGTGDDALGARARLVQVTSDAQLAQASVSKEEWAAFDELVHRTGEFLEAVRVVSNVTEMEVRADRTIDSELFLRAARAIGVYLSPVQIDVMCRVLDTNGDGRLSVLEFLRLSDSLTSLGLGLSPANFPHKLHARSLDPSAPLAQILRSSTGSSVLDIVRELPERTARWWSCVQTAPGPWTLGVKEGSGGCRQH
ncbi:hypothetical protein BCR44DRAFT_1435067 [Catenaria anguillulae PL171]|uniref:EF-hand domain-containing protein n=1 Tax=Catenaria anguillulae PL171 TaxID=765915 RepID=A0A1Y2HMR2_9FUNG|nr:hypothetical protein BCR44DRAFT_1435067 [Catenaria anguillulae PL171]